ncbi:MAG TPA: Bcr/CflA family efflux MFS transporter [Ramlibacter sp.]|nr:Bcr/CflA family efflux MFS transporter [Ramlibacter sp.]
MSLARVVALLSLLLGLQPVTMDLYLPALPGIAHEFGAPAAQAQFTLTGMLMAFGLSQLAWGPLSDRLGRRPVLLAGTAAYVVAALGCVLASSMTALVACRLAQGISLGAAVMGARALVRDLYDPTAGARALSRALSGMGVIACGGVIAGGLLAQHSGWRATMASTAVLGAIVCASMALLLRETLPPERRARIDAHTLLRTWGRILSHPTFLAGTGLTSASFGGVVTYLAASSFVFIDVLGLSRTQYGAVVASSSLVFTAGTLVCRRLLASLGLRRTVMLGGGLSLFAGALLATLALAGVRSVSAVLLPFWLYMLAHGIHQPCGQATSVAPFPQAAGAASAWSGCLMMVCAFVGSSVLAHVFADAYDVLVRGVWAWSCLVALVAWTLVRRHGDLPPGDLIPSGCALRQ